MIYPSKRRDIDKNPRGSGDDEIIISRKMDFK